MNRGIAFCYNKGNGGRCVRWEMRWGGVQEEDGLGGDPLGTHKGRRGGLQMKIGRGRWVGEGDGSHFEGQ